MEGDLTVLDNRMQRDRFNATLSGKRLLHVKGFGSGFKDANESQVVQENRQSQEAVKALKQFNPDFMVVDGDPWGSGFQKYIKEFVDCKRAAGDVTPQLIWMKDVPGLNADGSVANVENREKKVKQAQAWANQGISVIVYWLDNNQIHEQVNALFGADAWAKLEPANFDKRGDLFVLTGSPPTWVDGIDDKIKLAIEEVETKHACKGFEKCSFDNMAKGNLGFEALHDCKAAKHGVVTFGGGESVLLELGTKYLNSSSGFDARDAAVFPFSRGRDETDPKLPQHVGAAFAMEVETFEAYVTNLVTGAEVGTFKLPVHAAVGDLKQYIADAGGPLIMQQRLMYGTSTLSDERVELKSLQASADSKDDGMAFSVVSVRRRNLALASSGAQMVGHWGEEQNQASKPLLRFDDAFPDVLGDPSGTELGAVVSGTDLGAHLKQRDGRWAGDCDMSTFLPREGEVTIFVPGEDHHFEKIGFTYSPWDRNYGRTCSVQLSNAVDGPWHEVGDISVPSSGRDRGDPSRNSAMTLYCQVPPAHQAASYNYVKLSFGSSGHGRRLYFVYAFGY